MAEAGQIGPTVVTDPITGLPTTSNVSCSQINPNWLELKVEPVQNTSKTSGDGALSVTLTNVDGTNFEWSASKGTVDAVLVKGGNHTNRYSYVPEGTSGTGLHSPDHSGSNTGRFAGLSHVSFCYDVEQEISGYKYHDANGNHSQQQGEGVIPGSQKSFTFLLEPAATADGDYDPAAGDLQTTNGTGGAFSFSPPAGSYVLSELAPSGGWVCTAPAQTCSHNVTVGVDGKVTGLAFGNFVPAPGLTIDKSLTDPDDDLVHVGDDIEYTIVVKNTGNTELDVDLVDVIKDDDPETNVPGCVFSEGTDLTFTLAPNDGKADGADEATFNCTAEAPDADSYTNQACVTATDEYGSTLGDEPPICDDVTTTIIDPALAVTKTITSPALVDDESVVHPGDVITYSITVSNTGNAPLDVSMADVDPATNAPGCTFDENVPNSFPLAANDGGAGGPDERTFTCTKEAPDQASYTNKVCVVGVDELGGDDGTVGDDPPICDEVTTTIIDPEIAVTKSVDKSTARVGDTLTYTIVVSNPSETTDLVEVDMTDLEKGTAAAGCTFPQGTSMTFALDAGESKQFTCTRAMPDQEAYVNEVCVSGEDMLGGDDGTVGPECAEARTTIVRDPAPPEQIVEPTVEEPPPGQVVLGERIAPGAAALFGPTGCRGSAFRVRVAGTRVARVVFTLDGKRLKTLTKPNFRGQFAVRINPRRLKVGVHRLRATVTFQRGSGTRPKTMRLSFQRCARALQSPRFTG